VSLFRVEGRDKFKMLAVLVQSISPIAEQSQHLAQRSEHGRNLWRMLASVPMTRIEPDELESEEKMLERTVFLFIYSER
jgi:hypothetical protein